MGKGVDLARQAGATIHADVLDDLKDQLLIVFLKRLGGTLDIPVTEVDDTGGYTLSFNVDRGVFHFTLGRKQ